MTHFDTVTNEYGRCSYAFEDDYVHIYDLFIYPEFRMSGRARELLIKVIDIIRSYGYNGPIQIVADPSDHINREKLASFYRSLGLEVFECYM